MKIFTFAAKKLMKNKKNQCFNCIGFAFICYVLLVKRNLK